MNILNDYHVGYPDLNDLGAAFLVVLVQGSDGSLAVYSAIVELPDPREEGLYVAARRVAGQLVAARGNKETYDRAVTFFPSLPRDKYRA